MSCSTDLRDFGQIFGGQSKIILLTPDVGEGQGHDHHRQPLAMVVRVAHNQCTKVEAPPQCKRSADWDSSLLKLVAARR